MKKTIKAVTALCITLTLTACIGGTKEVTYRSEHEQESGLKMVDTMTLTAKKDAVQKIDDVIEIDMSGFENEEQRKMAAAYNKLVEQYRSIEGVECTSAVGTGTYTISLTIDTESGALEELSSRDMIVIEGEGETLSLESIGASLEENGYSIVE